MSVAADRAPFSPRRFLGWSFGVLSIGLVAVAAINFTIDPGSIFQIWKNQSGQLEKKIAAALNTGSNVATSLYFDVPLMKIATVNARPGNLDTLVLGSSRGMEVRASGLGRTGNFFNAYVSSANLQDAMAMYDACTAGRPRPAFVLWCVDPWIFNAGHPNISWDSLADRYQAAAQRIHVDLPAVPSLEGAPFWIRAERQASQWLDRAKQLISWGYTSESFKVIGQRWQNGEALFQPEFTLTHQDFEHLRVFRADGSVGFEAAYRAFSPKTVEQIALQYGRPPAFGLGDFSSIDARRREVFERFVSELQSRGTKVAFYLPPYHPAAYAEFLKDPSSRSVIAVEKYLHQYGAAHGIEVCGSFDPRIAGCAADEFFDAAHVHVSRVNEILHPLRESFSKYQ